MRICSVDQPRDDLNKSSIMIFDTDDIKADWFRVKYYINGETEAVYEKNLPERTGKR